MSVFNTQQNMQRGAALITAVIFFVAVTSIVATGVSGPVIRDMNIVESARDSRESFTVSEVAVEDAVYRLKNSMTVAETEVFTIASTTATTTMTVNQVSGETELVSVGESDRAVRTTSVALVTGSGESFNYGIQTGEGGLILQNSAFVLGNIYSNGEVSGNDNLVIGTVVSAGPDGEIDDMYIIGAAYANHLQSSLIFGNAYYQTRSWTFVIGSTHPGSDDLDPIDLPLAVSTIEEWKDAAEAGGVISSPCPYEIDDTETIGPVKIECDLDISGNNYTITVGGPIWVEGDISIQNSPTIAIDEGLGNTAVAIIADDESNRSTSSTIELKNSAEFEGTSGENSYVMMLSMNDSALNGGSTVAVDVSNSVTGDLIIYAPYGEVLLQNSISLNEVTAYRVRLKNSATINYESGLANLVFSSGPGGGFTIKSYKESE